MKKISIILPLLLLLIGCSTYQKAYQSDSIEMKTQVAEEMFTQGKYKKATNLYHQIYSKELWKPELKSLYFNYAVALDSLEKYELLVPLLSSYNMAYPNGPFIETTTFMLAKGRYELTDEYTKDQEQTYRAIKDFNVYLENFPTGEHREQAEAYKAKLNEKIEKKAFEAAKLYNTIGEYTRDYNAAIVSLNNFMLEYPGSPFKEDALYYRFDSAYKLAINSVYSKMEERLETAITYYNQLMAFNENTEYKKQADKMVERLNKELKQFDKE